MRLGKRPPVVRFAALFLVAALIAPIAAACTGKTGPAGVTGPQGPAGAAGVTGPQGLAGPTGPAGPQGLGGSTGSAGPQGVAGPGGPAGSQGPQGLAGSAGLAGAQGPVGPAGAVALPAGIFPVQPATVEGPIAITATSFPFAALDRIANPTNPSTTLAPVFAAGGYVLEEYFYSGTASTYDFADENSFALTLLRPSVPYTSRIQVLKPTDKSKFSGNVFVEIGHTNDGFANSVTLHDVIIDRGDAAVAVTGSASPPTVDLMKKFNPQRYAKLAWPAVTPADTDPDAGYLYDMLSQVGALLKSQDPKSPLAGYGVKYLYMGGGSRTAGQGTTYMKMFHPDAYLSNGRHVYDGFLMAVGGGSVTFINNVHQRTRRTVGASSLRAISPTIFVNSESEVGNYDVPLTISRRPDSDVPGDQFRLYEVPGTIHGPLTGDPARYATQMKETPPNDNPARGYVHRAAYVNLDRWVRDGTPPPRVDPIEVKNLLQRDPVSKIFHWGQTVRDEFGNSKGGVRNPWVDAPTATYTNYHTPGPDDFQARTGFFLYGYKTPFSYDQLQKLYGSHDNYAQKVAESADKMVRDRVLLPKDAETIKKAARDSNVLVGPRPAVSATPVPTPKPVVPRPASAPPIPTGWDSVREKVGYPDSIDYYVPFRASSIEMPPATALAVFHNLPGIELSKIKVPAGTTNAQLRDKVKSEKIYSKDLVRVQVTDEGNLTLNDGTPTVYVSGLGDHYRGWFFTFTMVFYVVGDAGYVLYAYDHTYKNGDDDEMMRQVLMSLHKM